MKVAVIFILVAPALSLQEHHHHPSYSCNSELDESRSRLTREYDYDQSPSYYRSSRRHRHKKHTSTEKLASAELEATNEEYIRHSEKRSHRHPKGHLRKYGNSDCVCDCMKCDDLQQCCQPVCNNECEQPEQTNQVEQTGLSPGNLVFVPYPYPLVVPPPIPPLMPLPPLPMVPAPAPDTTTHTSITTSTAPSIDYGPRFMNARKYSDNENKDNYVELLRSLRHRKDLPLSRDYLAAMRPVKRYIPEYGVMSDHIIDRLISRVRNVKDIH